MRATEHTAGPEPMSWGAALAVEARLAVAPAAPGEYGGRRAKRAGEPERGGKGEPERGGKGEPERGAGLGDGVLAWRPESTASSHEPRAPSWRSSSGSRSLSWPRWRGRSRSACRSELALASGLKMSCACLTVFSNQFSLEGACS